MGCPALLSFEGIRLDRGVYSAAAFGEKDGVQAGIMRLQSPPAPRPEQQSQSKESSAASRAGDEATAAGPYGQKRRRGARGSEEWDAGLDRGLGCGVQRLVVYAGSLTNNASTWFRLNLLPIPTYPTPPPYPARLPPTHPPNLCPTLPSPTLPNPTRPYPPLPALPPTLPPTPHKPLVSVCPPCLLAYSSRRATPRREKRG